MGYLSRLRKSSQKESGRQPQTSAAAFAVTNMKVHGKAVQRSTSHAIPLGTKATLSESGLHGMMGGKMISAFSVTNMKVLRKAAKQSTSHAIPLGTKATIRKSGLHGIMEGHYSCDCPFKDQEHKVICTFCSKNGHCSMWCCQQNKSESRACTRCGEIGHTASTHGLGCSSCDEYHLDGECRLSEVKCFVCECQDHYLAQCPLNFQGALRLALSKRGSTSSAPAKCSAKSEGKVLRADGSSPICFTCREEGHFAFQCPQNSPSMSEEFEESSTIATATNLSKELEGQDPGTAKQSSETKPILYDQCCPSKAKVLTSNKSSPMVRTCKTKTEGEKRMCSTCREEGHYARMCPQKFGAISGNTSKELEESSTIATSSNMSKVLEEHDPGTAKHSSDMKWVLRCASCGQEGHRARSCPTRVFICSLCNEEGHKAKKCPQKRQKR
uniref:CCHC-type domain-containing protein n=1 Tax=Aegilops tauschii TaxID=37682 RepID=M8B049_AEGTA